MKLSRRSWFAALLAPFAARFLPKPVAASPLDALNVVTLAALSDPRLLNDNFFIESPMSLLCRRKQDGAYIPCDGGFSIGQPLYYSRGMDPACADKSYSSLTIHNPLNLPVREDGANQCH